MKGLSLVILAAGLGTRYGGLKQLAKVSKANETIIDFSIFDAIRCGFNKVVFVIRKSTKQDFDNAISKKWKGKIAIEFVFQEVNNGLIKYDNKRKKPWGTGHALLAVKDKIDQNFAVINADDFYGYNAFKEMSKTLLRINKKSANFSLMGYLLRNTISANGPVSRGECFIKEKAFLESIIERTKIEKINGTMFYLSDRNDKTELDENTIVSMNFWGFTPRVFPFLEKLFEAFLKENVKSPDAEFFLPSAINELINRNEVMVEVVKTESKWLGLTYEADNLTASKEIEKMKNNDQYPKHLW